jgi:hypothetical protein
MNVLDTVAFVKSGTPALVAQAAPGIGVLAESQKSRTRLCTEVPDGVKVTVYVTPVAPCAAVLICIDLVDTVAAFALPVSASGETTPSVNNPTEAKYIALAVIFFINLLMGVIS